MTSTKTLDLVHIGPEFQHHAALWLDEERGLLFVPLSGKTVLVYHVLYVVMDSSIPEDVIVTTVVTLCVVQSYTQ